MHDRERAEPQPELVSSLRRAPDGEASPSRPIRILLVDDHADSACSLAMLLERYGFSLRTAASLGQALEEAERGFDVLVSDLALPDGTGSELLGRLRRSRGPIPAIAVTGSGDASDFEATRCAGFTEHLVKPIRLERLLEALRRATQA